MDSNVKNEGFFKEKYDVIIVGGGLSGLASSMVLAKNGYDVLVLEKHNLPGGLATSFVRGGVEIEATLHEMMSIGSKEKPMKIRTFLENYGVDINWLEVPEAYRVDLTDLDVNVTLHPGIETMAKEVDEAVPGTYEKVVKLMTLCNTVLDSVNDVTEHPMNKAEMFMKHPELVKTAGYSANEVIATFDLPQKAIDILSAYWMYVAAPMSTMPFTVYAVLMADYFRGSYVPETLSHGLSVGMERSATALGAQIEYRQTVEKIFVENGRANGVKTRRGDVIKADYVICGAYPQQVYTKMIEPKTAVPDVAFKSLNARKMSTTTFSVILILDKTPEELNIHDYNVFWGKNMETDRIYKDMETIGPYDFISTICLNLANPGSVPEGKTELAITALPLAYGWQEVDEDQYHDTCRNLADKMIDMIEEKFDTDLRTSISEVVIESPMSVAHYVGSWRGGIYGYRHCQDDNIVARLETRDKENYIEGLYFNGASAMSGNGMAPVITNGIDAAKDLMKADGKRI